jgi:hypothetical protein
VVGLLWAFLAPRVAGRFAGTGERLIAGDGTLALLGAAAAVVTAVLLAARPGPRPALRTGCVLVGSVVAGVLSWRVGEAVGAPPLRAVGLMLVWPALASLLTAGQTLLRSLRPD